MSRKQDVQVAQALGWRRIEWEGETTPMGRSPSNVLSLVLEEVPRYSEDIAAAWQLVGHLRAQGWVMNLSSNHFQTEPWDCRFFLESERHSSISRDRRVIAHGPTPAMAIAAAFLAAVD